MDVTELRAAAERVLSDPPLCRCNKPGCRFASAVAVARAWVAANPADGDEPVTAEWLQSIGLTILWYPSMLGPERTGGFGVVAGIDYVNGAVCLDAGGTTFATRIKARTRGHVRRLLAALGIA